MRFKAEHRSAGLRFGQLCMTSAASSFDPPPAVAAVQTLEKDRSLLHVEVAR